jgi:hypothetical protein
MKNKTLKTFWMSFSTDNANKGVIITDAKNDEAALAKVKTMGLYPGGQVLCYAMDTNDPRARWEISRWGKDRLINREELIKAGYMSIGTNETLMEIATKNGTLICEQCAQGVPHEH